MIKWKDIAINEKGIVIHSQLWNEKFQTRLHFFFPDLFESLPNVVGKSYNHYYWHEYNHQD